MYVLLNQHCMKWLHRGLRELMQSASHHCLGLSHTVGGLTPNSTVASWGHFRALWNTDLESGHCWAPQVRGFSLIMWWPKGAFLCPSRRRRVLTGFVVLFLLFLCSVASAMQSQTPDRYERLTSISSSVDYDQRDNVSSFEVNQKGMCVHVSVWMCVCTHAWCVFMTFVEMLTRTQGHTRIDSVHTEFYLSEVHNILLYFLIISLPCFASEVNEPVYALCWQGFCSWLTAIFRIKWVYFQPYSTEPHINCNHNVH